MKGIPVRNKIIETASDLFYQNGYNSTGINEIIKEAGIAKATLYHHFKSKDEICIAYLEHKNSKFLFDIEAFAKQAPKGKQQVLALFDFLSVFFKTSEFNGCWCINTISEIPRDEESIRSEIQKQKQKFIQLLESLVVDNTSHLTNAESMAQKVYLLYEGAVSESHLHQESWPIQQAKDLCEQIIR
ncbi:MAG: TetR/AcrR family transcriptional regulator [Flavobacteriales bacterium]|nr:TetR/AcrR family transcriptional regulator [Flavobacteriales bacterium]